MQHLLQISRKVDYALRAMIHLASLPEGAREPLQDIAKRNNIPREFLAKILKGLGDAGLVTAIRGPGGGVAIARPPNRISFLNVIEAVEGPIVLNVCLDSKNACDQSAGCSMQNVWKAGQERMLDVYRATTLAALAAPAGSAATVTLGTARAVAAAHSSSSPN